MPKGFLLFTWEIIKVVLLALMIVIPIRYFIFQPFFVRGQSMEPNFENADYLIIDEISSRFGDPERGEVVVFKYPYNPSQRYIKRIIGLPKETIEIKDGKVIIYEAANAEILDESAYLSSNVFTYGDLKITLKTDEYFVLGDNRSVSADSRVWGPITKDDIIGKVFLRAWPINSFSKFPIPNY